jgi:hypothetical protein
VQVADAIRAGRPFDGDEMQLAVHQDRCAMLAG